MASVQEENAGLLREGPSSPEEIQRAIREYRQDWRSRLGVAVGNLFKALPPASWVMSHPVVVPLMLFASRLGFLYDVVSDGLVARALIDRGNPKWGACVIFCMVLPYIIMVTALFRKATMMVSKRLGWPRWIVGPLWLLGGMPACVVADLYLNLKYLCHDPLWVEEFHYFTLRHMAELVEAQSQLIFQGYICLRQLNPWQLFPAVGGAKHVNPYLLGSSVAMSVYTAYDTFKKLRGYARNQTGNSLKRFFWHMCQLGEGLAPSNLFVRLRSRRSVVISYDLKGIPRVEMVRLAEAAKGAKQLQELIFEDASWIAALVSGSVSEDVVAALLARFLGAPNLRRLELRGAERVPDFAAEEIRSVARIHRFLDEVILEGHDPIRGSFVSSLAGAHPLLRAAHAGDAAAVAASGSAPVEVHSQALALAAFADSRELLRSVLLHPGGLGAADSAGGPDWGLGFAGDGAAPLHFAAAADSRDAVALLLLARANLEQVQEQGFTPLHIAAQGDCSKALAALLKAGADQARLSGNSFTALMLAAHEDHIACIRVLLAARADCDKATPDGLTALFLASQQNASESLEALLEARADPDKRRSDSATPLLVAAQGDNIESMELLLRARASPNLAEETGVSPLHYAAENGNLDCLQALLLSRADVDQRRNDGASALVIAANEGSVGGVELLIRFRADPQGGSAGGRTALQWAKLRGHEEVAAMLER